MLYQSEFEKIQKTIADRRNYRMSTAKSTKYKNDIAGLARLVL